MRQSSNAKLRTLLILHVVIWSMKQELEASSSKQHSTDRTRLLLTTTYYLLPTTTDYCYYYYYYYYYYELLLLILWLTNSWITTYYYFPSGSACSQVFPNNNCILRLQKRNKRTSSNYVTSCRLWPPAQCHECYEKCASRCFVNALHGSLGLRGNWYPCFSCIHHLARRDQYNFHSMRSWVKGNRFRVKGNRKVPIPLTVDLASWVTY